MLPRSAKVGSRVYFLLSARLHRLPLAHAPRCFAPLRHHCDSEVKPGAPSVGITFSSKGTTRAVTGLEGQNLVQLAHANDIELEGACECSLACSTCHVILEPAAYDALSPPSEEEEDLLDLAFGLTASCVFASLCVAFPSTLNAACSSS
jgi:ferredoxin